MHQFERAHTDDLVLPKGRQVKRRYRCGSGGCSGEQYFSTDDHVAASVLGVQTYSKDHARAPQPQFSVWLHVGAFQ